MNHVDCAVFEGATRIYYGVAEASFGSNEHGDSTATLRLRISKHDAFLLYTRLSAALQVRVVTVGHRVFEGRVEDVVITDTGATMRAFGYWRVFTDLPYTAFWSQADMSGIVAVTQEVNNAFRPERYTIELSESSFYIAPTQTGGTYANAGANNAAGDVTWAIPDRSSRGIIGVQFRMELVAVTSWEFRLLSANRNFTGVNVLETATHAGTNFDIAYHRTLTPADRLRWSLRANAAALVFGANPGDYYVRISRLRLVSSTANRVNTTLTANRSAGTSVTATVGSTARMYVGMDLVINGGNANSEIVTVESITSATQFVATFTKSFVNGNAVQGFCVTADEIAADLVAQVTSANAGQIAADATQIQSPGLDLLNASYEDARMADVLTELARYGGVSGERWEVGVERQRVYLRPQSGPASQQWVIDIADLDLEQTLDQLASSIYAVYKRDDGFTLRTAAQTDADAVTRYELFRQRSVRAQTTNAIIATRIAQTALSDSNNPVPRARFTTQRITTDSGAPVPIWFVRAGDSVTIRNLPLMYRAELDRIRTFRISEVQIDVGRQRITVTPETPLPELEYLVARRDRFGAQVREL